MSGRSLACACRADSSALARGHGGSSTEATKVYSGGDCSGDGWVLTGDVAPLYWRFWGRLVSSLASSGISSSSMWEKSTVGRLMASISPSKNLCIASSFLVCPTRSGVLSGLVSEFSANLT